MKILLASTSPIKLAAVEEAFDARGNVSTCACKSGVPEQPFGMEQTFLGASNRLTSALWESTEHFDLIVAIESGIVFLGFGVFVDIAVVMSKNPGTGKCGFATSMGLPMDPELTCSAIFRHKQSVTVGALVSRNPGDPHSAITNGAFSRKELLVQALRLMKSTK